MTTSERIRAAALGPTPWPGLEAVSAWLRGDECVIAIWWLQPEGVVAFWGADETERRMFLLFVSEAVK